MLKRLKVYPDCRMSFFARHYLVLLAASAMLFSFLQPACVFSKKSPPPAASFAPVRVVLLPFNVPEQNKDLSWTALALPVMLASASRQTEDLVIVPFWETMPVAIRSAGASRISTPETAASAANWMSAKWAVMGIISPTKNGISMVIDFIPAKSSQIPFRYTRNRRVEFKGSDFHEALRQFLRYLAATPIRPGLGTELNMNSVKDLAEALNREYGWFVNADPGQAQETVTKLADSDENLARLLFDPSSYPIVKKQEENSEVRTQNSE